MASRNSTITGKRNQSSTMSLHINLTPEAEAELRRSSLRSRLASLLTCLACVGLGATALYLSVVLLESEPNAHFIGIINLDDGPPSPTPPKLRHLSPRHAATPAPAIAPNLLVSTESGSIPLTTVDLPATDAVTTIGTNLDSVGQEGSSLAFNLPGEGGAILGDTETRDDSPNGGSTLEGVFYDLKQTRSGAKTEMASWNAQGEPTTDTGKVTAVLREFLDKNWSPNVLSRFYRPSTRLHAGCFYLPSCNAAYAPVAYRCSSRVKPKAWVALYKGKVKAPASGKFRFVGTGDDMLAVRFNKKTVLEAGWCIPSQGSSTIGSLTNDAGRQYHRTITTREKNPVTFYPYDETPKWNRELGGLKAGEIFEVTEGSIYPVEILISEIPGGAFGFALMIQNMSEPGGKKTSSGSPLLQLFRTNFVAPTRRNLEASLKTPEANYLMGGMECPPYDEDSPLWITVP